MKTYFHKQLDHLKMTLLRMAALTEKAIDKAVRAFQARDATLAQEVIEGDRQINELEVEIDRQCLSLLAREQPVARDLRFIIGAIRMSIDLERIGDQAVNVAQRTIHLTKQPAVVPPQELQALADVALDMMQVAISSFVNQNLSQARDVCQMDDEADELNYKVLRSAIRHMKEESLAIDPAVQIIITARCLERVADQATNIAESIVFILEGVNIKHYCEP